MGVGDVRSEVVLPKSFDAQPAVGNQTHIMKTTFLQSLLHLPVLNTILLLIASCSGVKAQTITWQENWESPAAQDDWYADLGIWEIGRPTSGLGPDHGGSNCAATVLDGDYPEDRRSRLVSAPILVPVAELNPRLRLWHSWSFGRSDFGRVQISTDDGGDSSAVFRPASWPHPAWQTQATSRMQLHYS